MHINLRTPSSGGSSSATGEIALVLQPGGTRIGNTYTDWVALMAVLDNARPFSRARIIFDDRYGTISIPAGGPYDMTDVVWEGIEGVNARPIVGIGDGATFINMLHFRAIEVQNSSATSPMLLEHDQRIQIYDYADVGCLSGAAPLFDGSNLSAGQYVVLDLAFYGALGYADSLRNNTAIDMSAAVADYLFVAIGEHSALGNDVVACSTAGTLSITLYSTSSYLLEQTKASGTVQIQSVAFPRFNQRPSRPGTPATSQISYVRNGDWIKLDAGAGSFTQGLPHIAHAGIATEWTEGFVTKVSEVSGVNGITLDPYLTETIEGASTYYLPPGATVELISDGVSNWTIVGGNQEAVRAEAGVWSKLQYQAPETWTNVASGIDFTATDSSIYKYELVEGSAQVNLPTGLQEGMFWRAKVVSDNSNTLTWASGYDWGESGAPSFATASGTYRVLEFYASSGSTIAGSVSELYGS